MAQLIIEILHRHGSDYHRVEGPVVRVGRALDNDVILTDPTVSPYHFVIRRNAQGDPVLHPLADENGIRMGSRRVETALPLTELPIEFDAGRTRIRVLARSHPVPPTRLMGCHNGGRCLFGHWGWALATFVLFAIISGFGNFLATPERLTWKSFWSDQAMIMSVALMLAIGLLLINRITSHRWDFPGSLSFVSLALTATAVLGMVTPMVDYFFTSALPGFAINLIWTLFLLPLAMGWFLLRLHHGSTIASVIFVAIVLSPSVYLHLMKLTDFYDLMGTFSTTAHFDNSLSPWDYRLQNTLSIEEFQKLSIDTVAPVR